MAKWTVGAARNLPLADTDRSWDGPAAKERIFGDGEEIDQERAKRAHLVYDSEAPDLKGSYKLPFADVVDGSLKAIPSGLRAAASRLPQADIVASVRDRARAVLDAYFKRMEESEIEPAFRAKILGYFGVNEAVRSDSSLEQLRMDLDQALNEWPDRPGERMHVMWTFSDRLIALSFRPKGMSDEEWRDSDMRRHIWEIPWRRSAEGAFTFGQPTEVKEVELYEPLGETQQPEKRQRLVESVQQQLELLGEAQNGAKRIKAIGVTADIVNGNGRRYRRQVLSDAIARLNSKLNESAGQGRFILTGEAEHPAAKGGRPHILETVFKWEAASLAADGKVILEGTILPTSKGRDLQALVENGVPVGISQRGYGLCESVTENGQSFDDVTYLEITGYDAVAQPSDPNGRLVESQQPEKKDEQPMNLEELVKALEEKPELKESLMKQLGLTDASQLAEKLGVKSTEAVQRALDEALKAKQELEERKKRDTLDKAITEAAAELPYDEDMNKLFVEDIRGRNPQTTEEVHKLFETKRKEYDALAAAKKLTKMGKTKASTIEMVGPVFERETGLPEYVKPAFLLVESMASTGHARRRDWSKVGSDSPRAELYAKQYLKRYDENYRHQLIAEAKRFEEAEQTSDLNLPYTVLRTLVEIAWPELIAANVFDFGIMQGSPELLFFEAYTGESGATVSVTDESVTGDHGNWVNLAQNRLRPGTVVLTSDPAGTTYAEGTDYVIDYAEGRLMTLASGATTDSQALLIDYQYDAIRKGEMATIERAKNTLSSITLTAAADRLAVQISQEAIVFSRSQLGYDAVGRTLSNVMREVRRRIDSNILYAALAACLRQANNSGGTWASASDPVVEFVEKVGLAKVKVYNRFYIPDAIVMSVTNADRLSNWDGFKRDGFPNAILNAAGFAGGVKGLPIFATPEFSDAYVMVVNRELVMHRVYQAMMLKGPFPSIDHDSGKLIAADQYYIEEFNNTAVPVIEKGAYMRVT